MPDVSNIKDSLQWSRALKGARAALFADSQHWSLGCGMHLGPYGWGLGKVKEKKQTEIGFGDFSKERAGDIGGHFSKEREKWGKEREVEMRAALWSTSSSQSRKSWP